MSDQSFHNFQLTVEFRWNTDTTFVKKNNSKNSSVMYLVPLETADTSWSTGIQFQIKESATGDFILLHEVTLKIKGKKQNRAEALQLNVLRIQKNPPENGIY